MNKKILRIRRSKRTRSNLYRLSSTRLVVHRTIRHIYAQIFSPENKVLVCASTVEKIIRSKLNSTGNKYSAYTIGKIIAERALKKGIIKVSFDRSGFKYHGRIESLANAARKAGLNF